MPCLNCNHTMQNLGITAEKVFWCPRCGALKIEAACDTFSVPLLVQRTKEFLGEPGPACFHQLAHRIGLNECLYPPSDRPA